MTTPEILAALKIHDQSLPTRAASAPPSLPTDLLPSLPLLDPSAKLIAIALLQNQDAPNAGSTLLQLTSEDLQIAAAASSALLQIKNLPPPADILAAIPRRDDPLVRARLYLALGNSANPALLDKLRPIALAEKDPDARQSAQTAAVKLKGAPERAAFFIRIQKTDPDHALNARDQLLYLNDPNLAKALIPWLAKEDPLFRLGSDRPNQIEKKARMKDLAVWTAHLLHVNFPLTPNRLANFPPQTLQECATALAALPNP